MAQIDDLKEPSNVPASSALELAPPAMVDLDEPRGGASMTLPDAAI
jgi:hypothetical protein